MRIPTLTLSKRPDALPAKEKKARGEKKQKTVKRKKLLPSRARFALLVGDEGAILVHIENHCVTQRYFAPECSDEYLKDFEQLLAKHPKAPMKVFLDTLDQHYVQQTLPPVSSFSTKKLMQKRLMREFPSVELKGAVMMPRQKNDKKEWNFMLVAAESLPAVQAWMEWVEKLPNICAGVYLFPLESEFVVKNLTQAQLFGRIDSPWAFVITHNKVSGFRQIVFQNGKMVFTRLSQSLSDNDPSVAAGMIEQEISSTIEYLRRMSLKDSSAVEAVIVAAADIVEKIDTQRLGVGRSHLLTPHSLAEVLGMAESTQPGDRFGDVVMLAAVCAAKKHVLTFLSPVLAKVQNLYKAMMGIRAAAALSALFLIYLTGAYGYDYWEITDSLSPIEQRRRSAQTALEEARQEAIKFTKDLDKLSDAVMLYDKLGEQTYTPMPFLKLLSGALGENILVSKVEWSVAATASARPGAPPLPPPVPPPGIPPEGAAPNLVQLPLGNKMVFGSIGLEFMDIGGDQEKLKKKSEALLVALKEAMPGYKFEYSSLQGVAKETDKVQIELGTGNALKKEISGKAELAFEGKVILTRAPVAPGGAP